MYLTSTSRFSASTGIVKSKLVNTYRKLGENLTTVSQWS